MTRTSGSRAVAAALVFAGLMTLTLTVDTRAPKRPPITGVAAFAAKVSSMDEARTFYSSILGLEEAFTIRNPIGGADLTTFKINDRQYVYVAQYLGDASDSRLLFVSFETADARALRDYLETKGVIVPRSIAADPEGNFSFIVKDPEGNSVQFIEYRSRSLHGRNKGKFISKRRLSDHALHVGYRIRDPEALDKFYKDILGYRLIWKGGSRDDRFGRQRDHVGAQARRQLQHRLLGNELEVALEADRELIELLEGAACGFARAWGLHGVQAEERSVHRQRGGIEPPRRERCAPIPVPRAGVHEALLRAGLQKRGLETPAFAGDPLLEARSRIDLDAIEKRARVQHLGTREISRGQRVHEHRGVHDERCVRGQRDVTVMRRDGAATELSTEVGQGVAQRVSSARFLLAAPEHFGERGAGDRSSGGREDREERELEPPLGERLGFFPVRRQESQSAERDQRERVDP